MRRERINLIKVLIIWFTLGMVYFTIEGIWRIPKGGYANICMLPIGGLCGFLVGSINQVPKFYNMKIIYQSLIGAIIVTVVEFLSGCILNLYLGLGIWDYSNLPFNLLGQICLPFTLIWFAIMPLCIWLEDKIRYLFFKEGVSYSLKSIYVEFITFK
jgi:uncharacterized membrane protein